MRRHGEFITRPKARLSSRIHNPVKEANRQHNLRNIGPRRNGEIQTTVEYIKRTRTKKKKSDRTKMDWKMWKLSRRQRVNRRRRRPENSRREISP